MTTSPILSGQSFSEEKTRQIIEAFYHDGFVRIPGVLEPDEIKALRDRTDELLDDPVLAGKENLDLQNKRYVQVMPHSESGEKLPFILRNTIELDPIFQNMLLRQPILGLAEAIVGSDCRFCGQNVLRNGSGVAIERWHVDGTVQFPVTRQRPAPRPQDTPTGPVVYGANGAERYRNHRIRSHIHRNK